MGLTVKGVPISTVQRQQAEILLGVVKQLNAGQICAEAIICAAIGESTLTNLSTPNADGYWGVLQAGSGESGSSANFPPPNGWNDSAGMATAFLQGGKGFGNGFAGSLHGRGAIAAVRSGITDPGTIATQCEDSGAPPSFYGVYLPEAKAIIAALGGAPTKDGTVGLGGSGTPSDGSSSTTYAFQVGGTSNPGEDVWTAINRLAQEVNWYLFSNGEYLYYLDGPEMIGQRPALYLDRLNDAGRIASFQATYDNTAYQYVSTHKRKFSIQHKTTLATITSPTEVQMDLICGIDEIRGGDVISLSSFGPADGLWIIGDRTRSVTSVTSSLTLVPPIQPLSEAAVAGTTGSSSSISTSSTPTSTNGGKLNPGATGGYVNPFGKIPVTQLVAERIDMGVDYAAPAGSPILAIGDATILAAAASGTGWTSPVDTQACVYYRLESGAYAGKTIYVAEDIRPTVIAGQKVKAGDTIATFLTSKTGLETGWGSGTPYGALAASLNQQDPSGDPGGWSSAAGASFNRLLVATGCKSGIMQAGGPHGTMPSGYP